MCLALGKPFEFSVVCVYVPCNSFDRSLLCAELDNIDGPIILMGDFNIVKMINDRWNKLGQALHGNELNQWSKICHDKHLIDVSVNSGLTWSNSQKDSNYRAARLDRIYCSNKITLDYPSFDCFLDKSCLLSDHYPLCFKASPSQQYAKLGWFHADVSLFKNQVVKSHIELIFSSNMLRTFMNHAKQIRKQRRDKIVHDISKAEAEPPLGSPTDKLIELKNSLRMEEVLEGDRALVYTRSF